MTPAEFLTTITGAPTSFADIATRLTAAQEAGGALWTAGQVCDVVHECFGDFSYAGFTSNQMMHVGSLINALWPLYPMHNVRRLNPGQSRKTVLEHYLNGEFDAVAGLRLPDATQTAWPPRPAAEAKPSPDPAALRTPPPTHDVDDPFHGIFSPGPRRLPPMHRLPPLHHPHDRQDHPGDYHKTGSNATNTRAVAQYFTKDRQYGGLDTESLTRTRATFDQVCDAFEVPMRVRAACIPFTLRQTDHNLPALVADHRGAPAEHLWELIHKRVATTARFLRLRAAWQDATLAKTPALAGDNAISRFERLMGHLALLQTQLPPRYHGPESLSDMIMDAIKGELFAATVLTDADNAPHVLAGRIKLMLATGPPNFTTAPTIDAPMTTTPPTPTFMTTKTDGHDPTEEEESMTVSLAADDPALPNTVFYVLRRFRGNAATPYRTERTPAQGFTSP